MLNRFIVLSIAEYAKLCNNQSYTTIYDSSIIYGYNPPEKVLNDGLDFQKSLLEECDFTTAKNATLYSILTNSTPRQYRWVLFDGSTQLWHGILSGFSNDWDNETTNITLQNMLALYADFFTGGIPYTGDVDCLSYITSPFSWNGFAGVVFSSADVGSFRRPWVSSEYYTIRPTEMPTHGPVSSSYQPEYGYTIESGRVVYYATWAYRVFGSDPAVQKMYCMRFEIFNGCSVNIQTTSTEKTSPDAYTVLEASAFRLSSFASSANLTSGLVFDGASYGGAVNLTIDSFDSALWIRPNNPGYNFTKLSVKEQKGIDIPKAIMLIKQWRFVCNLNQIKIAYNGDYYSGETVKELYRSQYLNIGDSFEDYNPSKSGDYNIMDTTNGIFQDFHFARMNDLIKAGNYSISAKVLDNTIKPGDVLSFPDELELASLKFRTQSVRPDSDDYDFVYINAYRTT